MPEAGPILTILKCEFVSAKISGPEIEQDQQQCFWSIYYKGLYKFCQLNPKNVIYAFD